MVSNCIVVMQFCNIWSRSGFNPAADVRAEETVGPRRSETLRAVPTRQSAELADRVAGEHLSIINGVFVVTDDEPGDHDTAAALRQGIPEDQPSPARLGVGQWHFAADNDYYATLAGLRVRQDTSLHVWRRQPQLCQRSRKRFSAERPVFSRWTTVDLCSVTWSGAI